MIDLITGTPGAGKTLFAISTVKAKAEKENRPVYYSGIADLTLPWNEIDPEKWFDCPANSIIVLDECQRLFRPRGNGSKVPDFVSELETHRHKGLDLVFITQHPMLIDSNVRRLVGKHFHVSRRFGMARSSIFEFESCKDQPLSKVSNATARLEWSYPKEAFTWYKSAEVHTVKRRIPAKFFIVIFAIIALISAVWWFVDRWSAKVSGSDVAQVQGVKGSASNPVKLPDPYQYFKDQQPRIEGLAHTAPIYDKVTAPITAPVPSLCVASASKCQCFSQQATRLGMPDDMCRSIVANGYFKDWQEKTPRLNNDKADRGRAQHDSDKPDPSDDTADWKFKNPDEYANEV